MPLFSALFNRPFVFFYHDAPFFFWRAYFFLRPSTTLLFIFYESALYILRGVVLEKRWGGGENLKYTPLLFWIYNDVRYRNCTWSGKITNIAEEVSDRMDLIWFQKMFKYDFRKCMSLKYHTETTSVLMELGEL